MNRNTVSLAFFTHSTFSKCGFQLQIQDEEENSIASFSCLPPPYVSQRPLLARFLSAAADSITIEATLQNSNISHLLSVTQEELSGLCRAYSRTLQPQEEAEEVLHRFDRPQEEADVHVLHRFDRNIKVNLILNPILERVHQIMSAEAAPSPPMNTILHSSAGFSRVRAMVIFTHCIFLESGFPLSATLHVKDKLIYPLLRHAWQTMSAPNLLELPEELIIDILRSPTLGASDIVSFASCCKRSKDLASNEDFRETMSAPNLLDLPEELIIDILRSPTLGVSDIVSFAS